MKKLFTSALLALVLSINVCAQEKTYFDENWEKLLRTIWNITVKRFLKESLLLSKISIRTENFKWKDWLQTLLLAVRF